MALVEAVTAEAVHSAQMTGDEKHVVVKLGTRAGDMRVAFPTGEMRKLAELALIFAPEFRPRDGQSMSTEAFEVKTCAVASGDQSVVMRFAFGDGAAIQFRVSKDTARQIRKHLPD